MAKSKAQAKTLLLKKKKNSQKYVYENIQNNSNQNMQVLQDISTILRRDSLISTTEAGSGHPSSCLSCAELISSLFFNEMSYDISNPFNPDNDEFVLSKGHASPILYSALFRAGCIKHNLKDLRKLSSPLEGHPIPSSLPWIKAATGSLGQGLSIGLGMAMASRLQRRNYRVFVLLGDSEMAEGSVWEAIQLAGYFRINNICAIIDVNKFGQRGETMLGHKTEEYEKRLNSFGWNTITIDGHNISEILSAFEKARNEKFRPSVIIAKTFKGKGVFDIQNKNGWHGKPLSKEELERALKEIPNPKMPLLHIKMPQKSNFMEQKMNQNLEIPTNYKQSEQESTRKAYGHALANIAKFDYKIIAVDAEVSNSTYSEELKKVKPLQFIEAYIAEQNMIGISLGLSIKGLNVFASTFSAFLSRAHDQLRMAALSSANLTVCGSHCGVSIGEDGASQMGLEDISLFRSLPNSIVFYPSDAVSTEKIVNLAKSLTAQNKTKNIKYIRTSRPKTPVIYSEKDKFELGEFKVLRESDKDKLVLVGSGITLHESLKAHEILKKQKFNVSVIDLYCIKPLNTGKLINFIRQHGYKLIITEDHYKEGGIGEMLSSELINSGIKIKHLYVNDIPHSGKSEELLDKYGISAKHIAKAAKSF